MYRITRQMTVNAALRDSQSHSQLMAKYQRELSTGIKLNKPSDDPAASARALTLKLENARFESDLSGINHVTQTLNQSVSHLLNANTLLTRAKQIASEITQPDSDGLREIHANEIDSMIDQLMAVGNASDSGRYLFGGANSDSQPYTTNQAGEIEYNGGPDRTRVAIGRFQSFEALYPGSEIFGSKDRQATVITGLTGATPSGGTDNASGSAALTVTHTNTTYAAGSGVTAGTRSADEDTVIGSAGTHQLIINDTSGNGSAGTISLNGGASIAFSNTDTNLQLRDESGRKVYVDTTSITGGFSGTVDLTADGVVSIDGGQTESAIDFSAVQMLSDSETGHVTGINSSTITRSGEDQIQYPGTQDVFAALTTLRDALRSSSGQAEIQTIAGQSSVAFDRHSDAVLRIVGEQSSELQSLQNLQERTQDLQLETQVTLGELEGANLVEAAIGMQNERQLLEMTYSSLSQILNLNLIDFLR